MDFNLLFQTIFEMAVLLGIGAIIALKISFTADIKKFLIFVIINIALPAIILNGFFQLSTDQQLIKQMATIFMFSIPYHIIGLFVIYWILKSTNMKNQKAREISLLSAFGNTALIGIPLCTALFGARGAVFAAVFDAGMVLTLWTLGVMFLQGTKKLTLENIKMVLTAPVFAVVIGIIISLANIEPHFLVKNVVGTVSSAGVPLAMFYIGMLMAAMVKDKVELNFQLMTIPILFKLIFLPLLGILFLMVVPLHENITPIILIQMAVPTIISAPIIMAFYQADEKLGMLTTVGSTLLSLVSISLMIYIGNLLL